MSKYWMSFSRFVKKINLPMAPFSFGLLFMMVILKFKVVSPPPSLVLGQAYTQLKQSDIIFCVMATAWWFLFCKNDKETTI